MIENLNEYMDMTMISQTEKKSICACPLSLQEKQRVLLQSQRKLGHVSLNDRVVELCSL